jgi:tetratricopeptide (TPR) repeat protein
VVAPEHVLRASQEISWAEQAYIFQTLHFTDLYDEGLHRGMSQEDFGSTLDGLYNGGFGLDHWRRMPLEMLEERVARFPQSAGLRGYLWVIARERALREPLAVIDEATRATGADATARALVDEGEAAFAAGDLAGAAQRFAGAASILPTLVTAWNDLAVALHEMGRAPEAQAAVENALFADPEDEDAVMNLELILARQPG